ncbi:hypothetical protein A2U01_0084890, partial [Trifolium medium]|nr:hypothetical protein [Trifolium medium]
MTHYYAVDTFVEPLTTLAKHRRIAGRSEQ